jgi:hypothetical protein
MALVPRIRCMSLSELQIHSLENYLNYSASAPMTEVGCGILSYLHGSDTEDSYV